MTNVCYDGTQFMYYASDSHDIPAKPLLNIGVYASSPTLDFKLSERDLEISDAEWVDVPSFLMFRSHPKHYFHTLLDDFLGLYRTMFFYTHGSPSPDNQILLMDDFRPVDEDDHFKEIRQVFSRRQPQRLSYIFTTLASSHGLLCFRNLAAGPGQHQLAGPGIKTVSASFVRHFRDYVVKRLELPKVADLNMWDKQRKVLILRRSNSRKVLNDRDIVTGLKNTFPTAEARLVLTHKMPFFEQVKDIMNTTILVGMHGAGMANMAWLHKGATLLELFPLSVMRPLYKTIAETIMQINYLAWHNSNKAATVFHPEVLDPFRLSDEEKASIMKSSQGMHQSVAASTFWLTQDTRVDVMEIVRMIGGVFRALDEAEQPKESKEEL